jgi:hypothetical protein
MSNVPSSYSWQQIKKKNGNDSIEIFYLNKSKDLFVLFNLWDEEKTDEDENFVIFYAWLRSNYLLILMWLIVRQNFPANNVIFCRFSRMKKTNDRSALNSIARHSNSRSAL